MLERASEQQPVKNNIFKKKKLENEQILREIENHGRRSDERNSPGRRKISRKQFLRDLWDILLVRVAQFFFFFLAVGLILSAKNARESSPEYVTPLEFLEFALAVFAVNAGTTCLDYAVFNSLEHMWTGNYDVVYYAYSVHGTLGHIISLVIILNGLSSMAMMQKLGSVEAIVSVCIIISICYSFKEFYLRRHHKNLLQVRLKSKLSQMEEWSLILSRLGQYQHPVKEQQVDENERLNTLNNVEENPLRSPGRVLFFDETEGDMENGNSFPGTLSVARTDKYSETKSDVESCSISCWLKSKVFCLQRSCCCMRNRTLRTGSDFSDAETEGSQYEDERQDELSRLSFWRQLKILGQGHLQVNARIGFTVIRSPKHAKEFGNWLFMHLTKNNTVDFTGSDISNVMQQCSHEDIMKEGLPHVCHPSTPDKLNVSVEENGRERDILCHALTLFRYSEIPYGPGSDVPVTRSGCVYAVSTAFKEIQFSRASLQDLNNLQESIKSVVDVIFFIFMFLLAQIVLNLDISKALAPLLTILFGMSFAFAQVLSNLFLSMAFVMFLLPFNVGNRVLIGKKGERIKGNILELSLMNTTMLTIYNEKLRIPNHVLFSEHIMNLSEVSSSVFEIPLVFALDGPYKCSQEKINMFIKRIMKFAKEDNAADWIDVVVFCDDVRSGTNEMAYSFWCTHRAPYHEVIRCYNGKTRMLEEMHRVQEELGIQFQKGLKML